MIINQFSLVKYVRYISAFADELLPVVIWKYLLYIVFRDFMNRTMANNKPWGKHIVMTSIIMTIRD